MIEELWVALEASATGGWVRDSRWGYAAVNALHILGVALLVGGILPLDLRRLGAFRTVPDAALARVLVPTAAAGLCLAALTGGLLFASRAGEYAALGVFQWKMVLVGTGALVAVGLHAADAFAGPGFPARRAAGAAVSAATWLAALALGRLIAFV